MPRHPNLTPRAKQIIRELKEVAEKKRSMSVRYHEHLMAELARLGLVRNEYALKGSPKKGTKSKHVPKKGQGESQGVKGYQGPERRAPRKVVSNGTLFVETPVREAMHGDKYGSKMPVKRRTLADKDFGGFRAMLEPLRVGKDGVLHLPLAEDVSIKFRRSSDRYLWGKLVDVYQYSKGVVIADKKTSQVVYFIPNKNLPHTK